MHTQKLNWPDLLNWGRFSESPREKFDPARSPWQADYDRIVYMAAFRRLQDKTQVFPMSESDYVRTRLTHSIEVSTVARTLGTAAGAIILDKHDKDTVMNGDERVPLRRVVRPGDILGAWLHHCGITGNAVQIGEFFGLTAIDGKLQPKGGKTVFDETAQASFIKSIEDWLFSELSRTTRTEAESLSQWLPLGEIRSRLHLEWNALAEAFRIAMDQVATEFGDRYRFYWQQAEDARLGKPTCFKALEIDLSATATGQKTVAWFIRYLVPERTIE